MRLVLIDQQKHRAVSAPPILLSLAQGRGMAERNVQQAQQARDELRRVVGFSVADEIQKLDGLKKAGSISDAEFARLRARLVEGGALAA
jgi:hypothetical protein